MLALNLQIFDEDIKGTGTEWYSSPAFNARLGRADWYTFIGVATNVVGVSPKVTVRFEHSADAQNWSDVGGFSIANLVENAMGQGQFGEGLSFVRVRVFLSGTDPGCRLRVGVSGRSYD